MMGVWFMAGGLKLRAAVGVALGFLLIMGAIVWGSLALYVDGPGSEGLRRTLAGTYAAIGLLALGGVAARRIRRFALGIFSAILAVVIGWWGTLEPSNDRDWQREVAVLPYATFDRNLVTVHNIRNFDYRSEHDFKAAYYDRTFDLEKLDAVDLLASFWMGPTIAHLFLSFGFGQDHLAISIEARKERQENYSALRAFFKQYELVYIVADERDVIRVRTNYRKNPSEDLYLFRLQGQKENAQRVFLDYMRTINSLKDRPQWYNALTANCTNIMFVHGRVNPGHLPYSWKVLLSGYVPQYLYETGRLNPTLPFLELMQKSKINPAAQAADAAVDFSRLIRIGLPTIDVEGASGGT
jgi:hypothetical protein